MRRGYELRLLAQRAETLHRRACELFNLIDENDASLHELASDTMCSAAELAGALRRRKARAASPHTASAAVTRSAETEGLGPKADRAAREAGDAQTEQGQ